MRVLLDHCAPDNLIGLLSDFNIVPVRELGWEQSEDGTIVQLAEQFGFDLLLTVDKNLPEQQNWKDRRLALLVLHSQSIDIIMRYRRRIGRAIRSTRPGTIIHIDMPKF